MDLSSRSMETEIMDDLESSGPVLDRTLRELEFINKWLGGNAVTIDALSKIMKDLPRSHTYHIVDVGCGGGDMATLIFEWGKRNGYSFMITGVDANPNVVEYARRHVNPRNAIRFETMNIFGEEFQAMRCDILIGTLFFHHFANDQLTNFLSWAREHVSKGVIINDIHRHPFAFHSIRILTKLFSRSPMVVNDAPLSVRRAFLRPELEDIFHNAGFDKIDIHWRWAFRWQVIARPHYGTIFTTLESNTMT